MISKIKSLFNDRSFLLSKLMTLARNLNHQYASQQLNRNPKDYKNLIYLQREIQEKEKTISEIVRMQKKS